MSKTASTRAAWLDPLWWANQQIRAAHYVAHMTETVVRTSFSAYTEVARSSWHAFTHGASPWSIATATATAPVREHPAPAAQPEAAPQPEAAAQPEAAPQPEAAAQLLAAEPRPELVAVPPAAELTVVPAARALTVVPPVPEPSAPPVPGWDELTLGSIRARLRGLSEDDLVAAHDWEESHGARPDVLSMLVNRLAKVRAAQLGA